jgi:hypothetical protein
LKIKEKKMCQFISTHNQVKTHDDKTYGELQIVEMMDHELLTYKREKTLYKCYLEITVSAQTTTTFWDGWLNIRFESLAQFFSKFQRIFKVNDFLKRGRFSTENRFLFYNYFADSLYMEDCKMFLDLDRINGQQIIFDDCFLKLEERARVKAENNIFFYYDDLLDKTYDATRLDNLTFPFYQSVKEAAMSLPQFDMEAFQNVRTLTEPGMRKHFIKGQKRPELMIDEQTANDPENILNLTLSGMPDTGVFAGRVMLGTST